MKTKILLSLFVFAFAISPGPVFAKGKSQGKTGKFCSIVEFTVADHKGKTLRSSTNLLLDATCGLSKESAVQLHDITVGLLNSEFSETVEGVPTNNAKGTACVIVHAGVGRFNQSPKSWSNVWLSATCGLSPQEGFDKQFENKGKAGDILKALATTPKTRSAVVPVKDAIQMVLPPVPTL